MEEGLFMDGATVTPVGQGRVVRVVRENLINHGKTLIDYRHNHHFTYHNQHHQQVRLGLTRRGPMRGGGTKNLGELFSAMMGNIKIRTRATATTATRNIIFLKILKLDIKQLL